MGNSKKGLLEIKELHTDVLIIGGGTSGCYAALTIARNSNLSVLIAEKADIRRSGCLAAGVNALNAYITKGHRPQDYVDYATKDAAGIVRHDLLLTAAEEFNNVTHDLEKLGLVILKDENGEYVARGNRNIKINGENIKPILADVVRKQEQVEVLNHVNITELLVEDNSIHGAVGFSVRENVAYVLCASKVLIATGGAAGLYRPNNPGFSRHKMWYPPFNTGAGFAMGIEKGAEMTTFEMRFIALRCKDTIAPTGTLAQGVGAKQINSKGDVYETKYGITTSERVYGTVCENVEGRGPCYLKTTDITDEQSTDLLKAYLNMAPSQTLKWIESGKLPHEQDVEIEGTEPYIVGGHTASGYWVDTDRQTTIEGLYAAGDVAGGCPQKYVTGALAEGKIAALAMLKTFSDVTSQDYKIDEETNKNIIQESDSEAEVNVKAVDKMNSANRSDDGKGNPQQRIQNQIDNVLSDYERILGEDESEESGYSVEDIEEAMQKVMDEYAGGIATNYRYNEKQLSLAKEKINQLVLLSQQLNAESMHELLFVYELKERLTVCKSVIAHLEGRKETRWHAFNENLDYPDEDSAYYGYVNSRLVDGEIKMLFRPIVEKDRYEHTDGEEGFV